MMEVLFVRHGKTSWNKSKKMQGQVDISLNEEGIEHANHLAYNLKDKKIDIAFCSPLKRAKETMNIINETRENKIPVFIEESLTERDYGLYEGRNKKLFNYDIVWDYNNPLNIKNFFNFAWPIIKFVYNIIENYKNKTVLIVSHGGVSKIFEMILGKSSLYPEELATYLPNNSEIVTYIDESSNGFLYNKSANKEERENDKLFSILTPNIISLYFSKIKINELVDFEKISNVPQIRYRAEIIFENEEGQIAIEKYSKTKEYKLPARTINQDRRILHQVREILLQMTGYLGEISDFSNIGEFIEIRPSDPVAEIVCTQVYYINKATHVSKPIPDEKDEEEGFEIEFHSPKEILKKVNSAIKTSKGLKGKFYRPLITKKSIALREKFIFEYWNKNR